MPLLLQDFQLDSHDQSLYSLPCRAKGRETGYSAKARRRLIVSLAIIEESHFQRHLNWQR